MQPRFLITLILAGSTALVGAFASAIRPAIADVSSAASLSVEMTLATSNTMVQGEPIMLKYRITNADGVNAFALLGVREKGWYTTALTDAAGHPVTTRVEVRPLTPWERLANRPIIVQAYSDQQGYIVPNYTLMRPGKYTLSVHVRLPYGPDQNTGTPKYGPLESFATNVCENDYTFPLTIAPTDTTHLRGVAEALEREVVSNKSTIPVPALIQELCSIPEEQAWPSWQALADASNATNTAKIELAKHLVSLHTNKAVDILAQMVWSPAQGSEGLPTEWLIQAYVSGDNALKQHIKNVYAQYGVAFPENPQLLQVDD